MKTYSYYPGCSLEGTAREYEISLRAVAPLLGFRLEEMHDWSCCGSTPAHATSHRLAVALAARNLNLAAAHDKGPDGLAVPCAACYSRLKIAVSDLARDAKLRADTEEAMGEAWRGGAVHIMALPEILARDVGPEAIERATVEPLNGIKVANYYGCLLVRPPEMTGFDDPEDPQTLDEIVRATGAEAVDWSHKVDCCGGSLSLSRTSVVSKLVADIIDAAQIAGADCIVTACPMCHANVDTRQPLAAKILGRRLEMPVLYITQLLGLALGVPARQLGFRSHLTPVTSLLRKLQDRTRGRASGEGGS